MMASAATPGSGSSRRPCRRCTPAALKRSGGWTVCSSRKKGMGLCGRFGLTRRWRHCTCELARRFFERTVFRDRPIETLLAAIRARLYRALDCPGFRMPALLLFCKDPLARWHPRAGVRLFRVNGRERTHGAKRNVNQIGRVEGPLAAAIEATYKSAKEQIRQSEKLHDLFFKEVPDTPSSRGRRPLSTPSLIGTTRIRHAKSRCGSTTTGWK